MIYALITAVSLCNPAAPEQCAPFPLSAAIWPPYESITECKQTAEKLSYSDEMLQDLRDVFKDDAIVADFNVLCLPVSTDLLPKEKM